jgi:hypothetical protein
LLEIATPEMRAAARLISFFNWFGLGVAVCLLNGPVIGSGIDHNGWRFLVGPLVCAFLAGAYWRFFPPNPYRGPSARGTKLDGLDGRNPKAAEFVALFRSPAAKSVIARAVVRVALIEFAALVILFGIYSIAGRVSWSIYSSWFWYGIFGGWVGSFLAVGCELYSWVLRTWVHSDYEGRISLV